MLRRLPSIQHAPGHHHALQIHPVLRWQTDVSDEECVQVAVTAPQGAAHICNSVAFAQSKAFETIIYARESFHHAPRLI